MKGMDKNFITTVKPGDKFNRLTIVSYVGKDNHGRKKFLCKCDCGNEVEKTGTQVKNGYVKSCGCLHSELAGGRLRTHGYSGTRIYEIWKGLKGRCNNPNYEHYHRYGGRGITYEERWEVFENFLKDMGEPPTLKHQLDRIDNDGNYTKENCRWVTPKENCNNRKVYKSNSGFTGVYHRKATNRYLASFNVDRKQKFVGSFNTPEEAYDARVDAIKKYNQVHGTNLKYVERVI